MKEKTITLGIDTGNSDIKSRHTQFISGYSVYEKLPYGASQYLFLDGIYYVPNMEGNFVYEINKCNKKWLILTLISISKEILFLLKDYPENEVQSKISNITTVNLALGLPPADMQTLKDEMLTFYHDALDKGISYRYANYDFHFKAGQIAVYPQDVAALLVYAPKGKDILTRTYKTCIGIDVGGYTLDIVKTINGRADMSSCDSLPYGINVLCDKIESAVRRKHGTTINKGAIIDVLSGSSTLLDETEIKTIKEISSSFADDFINKLVEKGYDLKHSYVIFLGGGSKILRNYIVGNSLLNKYGFIANTKINAEGFEKLLKATLKNE